MTEEQDLSNVISESLGAVFKQSDQIRKNIFEAAEITISFPLRGHTISVKGLNPDVVFNIAEKSKIAGKRILTKVK